MIFVTQGARAPRELTLTLDTSDPYIYRGSRETFSESRVSFFSFVGWLGLWGP